MYCSDRWQSYELIDAGDGEKLERWNGYLIQRPDPQAVWPHDPWPRPDAVYLRSKSGGGSWRVNKQPPNNWHIRYDSTAGPLVFGLNLMGFKHTGLFPEQAANWEFAIDCIRKALLDGRQPRILNLFAYTGAASLACAAAGAAEVLHLDASKGMNNRARDNIERSGLTGKNIRLICDDAKKFVEREIRRGRTYDGIIMDPPAYGRGPSGELWTLEESLFELVTLSARLLSDKPLFFILNTYASALTPTVLTNILNLVLTSERGGQAEADELCLLTTARSLILPCGATGRWRV